MEEMMLHASELEHDRGRKRSAAASDLPVYFGAFADRVAQAEAKVATAVAVRPHFKAVGAPATAVEAADESAAAAAAALQRAKGTRQAASALLTQLTLSANDKVTAFRAGGAATGRGGTA